MSFRGPSDEQEWAARTARIRLTLDSAAEKQRALSHAAIAADRQTVQFPIEMISTEGDMDTMRARDKDRRELTNAFIDTDPTYYYSVGCHVAPGHPEHTWVYGPRLATGRTLLRTQYPAIRQMQYGKGKTRTPKLPSGVAVHPIRHASWHFGWLMTPREMRLKMCSNTDMAMRAACVNLPDALIAERAARCEDPLGSKRFDNWKQGERAKQSSVPLVRADPRAPAADLPEYVLRDVERFLHVGQAAKAGRGWWWRGRDAGRLAFG